MATKAAKQVDSRTAGKKASAAKAAGASGPASKDAGRSGDEISAERPEGTAEAGSLGRYHAKRDFTETAEPRGTVGTTAGHAYLIQKHDARRLHYDLRLEMDGVLKSWAVTKGPSLVPGEKRLAVHVEDHPLDYGTFEGTIPKGHYGGGTVMLWDRGSWSPVGDAERGYRKGHLEFELHGEKLSGRWHLVRMHTRPGEKADNWLLIKAEDAAARPEEAADILEEQPDSVKTGRDLKEIAVDAPAHEPSDDAADAAEAKARATDAPRKRVPKIAGREATLPAFVEPELATLVARTPSGKDWLHEVKFDGYRLQVRIDHSERAGRRIHLMTRSGLDWTERFGSGLVAALDALPTGSAIIDGELVVESDAGASSFALLQQDLSQGRSDRFVFYGFDLLFRDGRDLRGEPLRIRAAELADLFRSARPPLRLSEPFDVDGEAMLKQACRLSLEGIVSKRASAAYRSGRGRDWVKSKCANRQEFVIGGYVPSTAHDHAIRSLVLGVYEAGKLRHVGRVGTGYSRRVAEDLRKTLSAIERARSPFAGKLTALERRDVVFVAPERVAEVEFRGWTGDDHIRQGSFRGLREDKSPKEIVREEPVMPPDDPERGTAKGEDTAPEAAAKAKGRAVAPSRRAGIKLTHPDRIYWPEDGITKQALADYYGTVWTSIAPFVVGRPLALLRCPDGIAESCFFQKHAWQGINRAIRITRDTDGEELLSIDDFDGLIALVQSGAIEIHPWQAPLVDRERPDMMIFDLDPGEGVGWPEIVAGARAVRDRLEALGLPSFVKTSGGKGLHVTVPLKPAAGWDAVKGFAKGIAEAMAADDPDRYVSVATKARRDGRIFVDYLRNGRGATAIVAYGVRARAGAGVSMPLAWDDLDTVTSAAEFTLENTPARLANRDGDPWDGFRKTAAPLPDMAPPRRRR